ncbi:MAG: hypothetical protein WBQ23_10050 [Bacteroidota bacterium]
MNYFTYKEENHECPHCGWIGKGTELVFSELYSAVADYKCPSCNEEIFTLSFTTIEQMNANRDLLSDEEREELDRAETFRTNYYQRMVNGTSSLPEIADDEFIPVWDCEHVAETDAYETVVRHGSVEILREMAAYEGYNRFYTIVRMLKEHYGENMLGILPTDAGWGWLLGDRIKSIWETADFLVETFGRTEEEMKELVQKLQAVSFDHPVDPPKDGSGIAHGNVAADAAENPGDLRVPPAAPPYSLRWEQIPEEWKRDVLQVWVAKKEYDWAKRIWDHMERRRLTSYSNIFEYKRVVARFLCLAWIHKEFCSMAFEESFDIYDVNDVWSAMFKDNFGELDYVAFIKDREVYAEDSDLYTQLAWQFVETEYPTVVDVIYKSHRSKDFRVFEELFLTGAGWNADEILDEIRDGRDPWGLYDTYPYVMSAYEWVRDGMPLG